MHIPKLKRIKVSSEQELRKWLSKNSQITQDVMIVTSTKKSPGKHVPSALVRDVLRDFGWCPGQSYTLPGDLYGHIVTPA